MSVNAQDHLPQALLGHLILGLEDSSVMQVSNGRQPRSDPGKRVTTKYLLVGTFNHGTLTQ